MFRKLSSTEISRVVAKIRSKYDEYCTKYFKTRKVKDDFEERYRIAIRGKADISNFLLAEISAVEELIDREEKRIEEAEFRARQTKPKANFADKILEEHKQKIAKYPDISIHKDCNPELKKLLGALNELYEKYFPAVHHLFRVMTPMGVPDLYTLENQLRYLGALGNDRVSPRLTRYYSMLSRFPRDYKAMEREEKDFILESAFLLHELHDTLALVEKQNPIADQKQKKDFEEVIEYIDGIISDFRLKDLKKKK